MVYDIDTVVLFQVWYKLNYFLVCRFFWILIINYEEIFFNSCNQPNLILEPLRVAFSNNLLTTLPQKH